MFYVVICTDKPGHLEVRQANRADHVAYLKSTNVTQAGPFLDANGDMCGSLVILDVADRAEAEAWAAADPYKLADLFTDVRIEAWNRVIG
ncbi:YciI family protein [Thalassobacter stenotrophicus]|uniref:YciI family protein n=1 Tax=Thalassobacter stenotrophicus TaxID=266809 RepID=UPI0022A8F7B7|nr:YciI family protein [Thalassobacter stenotrophicus]UYP68026.1 YciI family protein [Thalassobacter stenotrophicus]